MNLLASIVRALGVAAVLAAVLAVVVSAQSVVSPQDVKPGSDLEQRIERFELRDVALGDALRILSEESGVNLSASEDAASKHVSAFLLNVTVRQAIESVTKAYGLWYREDAGTGVVRVLTAKEFERDLSLFRDEKTTVFTLYYPNSLDIAYAIRNLYGDRVRLSVDREYLNEEYNEISQRFQRFDLLDRRAQGIGGTNGFGSNGQNLGFQNSSLDSLSQSGNYSNNGGVGYDYQQRIQDRLNEREALTADQIEAFQRAAAEGREAATEALDKMRGTQTSIYVTVIRRNNMVAVRSSDQAAVAEIEKLVKALDVPTPQVLLEVSILSLDLGDDFDSAIDASYGDGTTSVISGMNPLSALTTTAGFAYQYVNDKFQARITFLADRKRVTQLATPVLLVANNEVARLFIGEVRPIVTNISSSTSLNLGTSVTTPNTTIEMRPVGTTLLLTPNVNADRTVTLRVLQENSNINPGGATIPIINGFGGVTETPVDTVRSRTVTGTVVAKDGLTLALGGLVEESIQDMQSGIPGLMDLPVIGIAFRSETKSRSRTELIVLVRPHVLFTASEGQEMSRDLTNRLSIHSSAETMGGPLGAYDASETPRAPLGKDPLSEILKFQSGLPDGGG